jgi:hypothetical protein
MDMRRLIFKFFENLTLIFTGNLRPYAQALKALKFSILFLT